MSLGLCRPKLWTDFRHDIAFAQTPPLRVASPNSALQIYHSFTVCHHWSCVSIETCRNDVICQHCGRSKHQLAKLQSTLSSWVEASLLVLVGNTFRLVMKIISRASDNCMQTTSCKGESKIHHPWGVNHNAELIFWLYKC